MARDPVCNNEVDLEEIRYQSSYKDDLYWFDSPECKDLFDADPEKYVAGRDITGHIKGEAKKVGKKAARKSRSEAKRFFSERKGKAEEFLGNVTDALRSASDNLHGEDRDEAARYVDKTAEQAERFSGYIRDNNADEILRDAEEYVRNRPAMAIGSAMLAGFIFARFLKSGYETESAERHSSRTEDAL